MNEPFIIIRPDLGKRPYRLWCGFIVEPHPTLERLKQAAGKALELFVRDRQKRGWDYWPDGGLSLKGPFTPVVPMTLHRPQPLSSQEMLPGVTQGNRYRAGEETLAKDVTPLEESEYWEYKVGAVFVHNAIRVDRPAPHEELEVARR